MTEPDTADPQGARARLFELSQGRGVSLARLSTLLGRNPSYLQQFIRKGSPRKLEEEDRRTLAEFLDVPEWELRDGADSGKEKSYISSSNRKNRDWVEVARLDIKAAAGPGTLPDAENAYDLIRFSRRWLAEQGLESAELSAITVKGDSMEPLLRDGDEILVDMRAQPFRDGIHVVRLSDTLMVKRVARSGAGRAVLLSENAAYPPIDVALDEVELIGRVVWKGGRI
ncbi:MAG: S24 family peptidase [Erythrobacter sp.]|uniref:S24 family peptidase n=1 Tax=Erythrobacter sp. TaxID=1042 RepID=UPI003C74B0E6